MHVKIESKFVRPNEHVRDGEHIVFVNEGEERQGQYGKKFNILVRLPNGEEKLLSLNNSSKRNMIGHYGGDSAKWIGKEAR
jgi:phage repressor protein C with HTH and peptisase S24 domain